MERPEAFSSSRSPPCSFSTGQLPLLSLASLYFHYRYSSLRVREPLSGARVEVRVVLRHEISCCGFKAPSR
ncbi:unnamed protein product [Gadus morhua 'NCC']